MQVLTNVGLEHTRWLGPTERHIAEEKLAVVPAGGTLVTGPLGVGSAAKWRSGSRASARRRLIRAGPRVHAGARTARRFSVDDAARPLRRGSCCAPLGRFQRDNFALAVVAAEEFLGGALDPEAVRATPRASCVCRDGSRSWRERPLVVLDGAHNPTGAQALGASLEDAGRGPAR